MPLYYLVPHLLKWLYSSLEAIRFGNWGANNFPFILDFEGV